MSVLNLRKAIDTEKIGSGDVITVSDGVTTFQGYIFIFPDTFNVRTNEGEGRLADEKIENYCYDVDNKVLVPISHWMRHVVSLHECGK